MDPVGLAEREGAFERDAFGQGRDREVRGRGMHGDKPKQIGTPIPQRLVERDLDPFAILQPVVGEQLADRQRRGVSQLDMQIRRKAQRPLARGQSGAHHQFPPVPEGERPARPDNHGVAPRRGRRRPGHARTRNDPARLIESMGPGIHVPRIRIPRVDPARIRRQSHRASRHHAMGGILKVDEARQRAGINVRVEPQGDLGACRQLASAVLRLGEDRQRRRPPALEQARPIRGMTAPAALECEAVCGVERGGLGGSENAAALAHPSKLPAPRGRDFERSRPKTSKCSPKGSAHSDCTKHVECKSDNDDTLSAGCEEIM